MIKLFYTYLAGAIEADKDKGGAGWRDDITPALDKAEIYIQDPCLAGDSPILMGDLSYKSIKNVKIGDNVFGLKGNYLTKTIVTKLHKRKAMTYKLVFEDGRYLIITENHPILQYKIERNYQWVKATELNQTRLCVHPQYNQNKNWTKGYIAGFLDGDGNITFDDKLRFFQKDKGQLEYIEQLIKQIYGNFNESYHRDLRTGVYTLGVYSPKLSRKILKDIKFPKTIRINYFRGYLAGIYDAEGCKKNCDQIIIYNTNPEIIQKAGKCLEALGHKYTIRKYRMNSGKYKSLYKITCHLDIQPQRANFVIECQPYQRQYFIQDRYQIRNSKILKVHYIIPYRKIWVYNFETLTKNYIANGIIVHNCKTEPLVTGMDVLEAQEQFNKWIMSGNYDKFAEKFEKIVQKDIRMVHRSDFVIVHLFPDIPTTGTIHEMAEAWRLKKPIYLIWKDAKSKVPKWALYLTTSSGGRLFDNGKQLTDYIALRYKVKNQSLRIQIVQFCKAICRLIGERIYTYKLNKIKEIWKEKKIIKDNLSKSEEKKEEKKGK